MYKNECLSLMLTIIVKDLKVSKILDPTAEHGSPLRRWVKAIFCKPKDKQLCQTMHRMSGTDCF